MANLCNVCNKEVSEKDLFTYDQMWEVISESELLLAHYEVVETDDEGKEHERFPIDKTQRICWNCLYQDIEEVIGDELSYEDQLKIRKEYKDIWGSDGGGNLSIVLDGVMRDLCISCGDVFHRGVMIPLTRKSGIIDKLSWGDIPDEMKKVFRKLIKGAFITSQQLNGVLQLCQSCRESVESELIDNLEPRRLPIYLGYPFAEDAHRKFSEKCASVFSGNTKQE